LMPPKPIPLLWILVLVILLGIVSSGRGQSKNAAISGEAQMPAQWPSEPVGDAQCVVCHRAEVEGYARSAMAHSLRRAGQEPDGSVTTPDTKITMDSSPAGYRQHLKSGEEDVSYRVDYVIGSGNHAAGYLVDIANHLFQSPVAYYTSRHAYDLAPGYEGRPNPDFTRPVSEGCLFCHSGAALPVAGTSNEYRPAVFAAEAITCARCHGSAEKHLSDPRAGNIINPAKLEPAARDSICEQCHLLGVGKVLNPGKTFNDFRPGEALEEVYTTYVNALPPGSDVGKFKVISHVEQLARSTCARMSSGRLWCGTCHDPHNKPLDPVPYYRAKCLTCHTGNFTIASHPAKNSNCIGCHMPRRNAKDGGHTAFTDHRIQRRPQIQPDLPGDIDIAAWREPAPELQKRNLGIAYVNAGMERRSPTLFIRGYRMLTEVQREFATDSDTFASIGNALLLGKQPAEAEIAFERSLQLDPNSVTGETNAAAAYLQAGDADRAIAHLERAVALDPLHLAAIAPLIGLYKQQGNAEKAAELSGKVAAAMESQATPGETATSPASAFPPAEAVYKNIQVLKGVSSDQLIPAMRFIGASLGVECNYCHVEGHFEKDDKKPKETARNMMRMMLAIDKDSFAGNREVTCYSCHRGSAKPEGTPTVGSEMSPSQPVASGSASETDKLPTNLPNADQIIDNYIQAVGGAAAIEKITSRVGQGTTTAGGKSISVEVFDQDPDKEALVRHTPTGDSITVFNHDAGWTGMTGRALHEMHSADIDAAQMDADLHFPLHIKRIFDDLRVEYPEKIGDREAYVILGTREGQLPVKFYFDEQSGLLVRLVRYAESPLGRNPTQIDYSDYRETDGVEIPFRWMVAQPDGSSTIQWEQMQQNVPIDGAKFVKPAEAVASSNPPAR
jgi:photosynthetic reaction center cytochrome c subunit